MEDSKITTVKLRAETKARLNKLKEYAHESYDEIIGKILEILNLCKNNPDKAGKILYRINFKRLKLKNSSQYSEKELEEKFGF
jgi:hypothetical protein